MASGSVGEGNPLEEVGGDIDDDLFRASGFVKSLKGKVEEGELLAILPTAIVGNGNLELGVGSSFNELGCVGKGNENGKMYFPRGNRPSTFCDVEFASEWRGLPIDLSHNVKPNAKNCKDPSEVAAETTFPFTWDSELSISTK